MISEFVLRQPSKRSQSLRHTVTKSIREIHQCLRSFLLRVESFNSSQSERPIQCSLDAVRSTHESLGDDQGRTSFDWLVAPKPRCSSEETITQTYHKPPCLASSILFSSKIVLPLGLHDDAPTSTSYKLRGWNVCIRSQYTRRL